MFSMITFLGVFLDVCSNSGADLEGVFLTGVRLFSHLSMLLRLLLGFESASLSVCAGFEADLVNLIDLTLSHSVSLSSEIIKKEKTVGYRTIQQLKGI